LTRILTPNAKIAHRLETAPALHSALPALLTLESALAPAAPLVHDDRPGNVMCRGRVQRRDAAALPALCNSQPVDLTVDGGATLTLQAELAANTIHWRGRWPW